MSQQVKYSIIGSIIIALILAVSYFVSRTKKIVTENKTENTQIVEEKKSSMQNYREEVLKIHESDVIIGNVDAPVTIFEYASYSCSHCANFTQRVYPSLKKEYIDTGKVRFILRDFPLDEPSLRAAQLTRCVPKEGYESLSKTLFQQRQNWAYGKDFPEKLENIAKIIGMSGADFHACMENKEVEDIVLNYRYNVSKAYNLTSTPSFIINGKKYTGNSSFSAISEYLDKL